MITISEYKIVADIESFHGHGIPTIQQLLNPEKIISLDRWYEFLLAQSHVIKNNNVNFITMCFPNIPLKDKLCDAVFLIYVIEHLPDIKLKK